MERSHVKKDFYEKQMNQAPVVTSNTNTNEV